MRVRRITGLLACESRERLIYLISSMFSNTRKFKKTNNPAYQVSLSPLHYCPYSREFLSNWSKIIAIVYIRTCGSEITSLDLDQRI